MTGGKERIRVERVAGRSDLHAGQLYWLSPSRLSGVVRRFRQSSRVVAFCNQLGQVQMLTFRLSSSSRNVAAISLLVANGSQVVLLSYAHVLHLVTYCKVPSNYGQRVHGEPPT